MRRKHEGISKTDVLILIETSRGYGRDLIAGITQYATEKKTWNLFLCDQITAKQNTHWLNEWKGDGVIARAFDKSLKYFLHHFEGPKINLAADGTEFPIYVRLDNEICAKLAAEHFWNRGYRSFAFFSMGYTYWSRFRYHCFVDALKKYDLTCELCPQARKRNSPMLPTLWWKGLDDSVIEWINSLPKPVGIFCAYDNHAFYLTNLCSSSKIAVPEEVAILGVDNDESLCKAASPPISSIDPNAKRIGYESAVILDKMMRGNELPPLPVTIRPSFIAVRQSTDNIAVNDATLAKILQFLRSNVAINVRVGDLAKKFSISRGTLNNLFRKHLHCKPIDEILRVRMEWAKELLRNSQISITEISEMVGYQTPEYFSRAFSRESGFSPRAFRHQSQQNRDAGYLESDAKAPDGE